MFRAGCGTSIRVPSSNWIAIVGGGSWMRCLSTWWSLQQFLRTYFGVNDPATVHGGDTMAGGMRVAIRQNGASAVAGAAAAAGRRGAARRGAARVGAGAAAGVGA